MSWWDVGLLLLWAVCLLLFLSVIVLGLTYLERKVLGRIQMRMGPMRTGPYGLLQPIADAIKLMVKEDIVPSMSDRVLFWLAPLAVFVPAFLVWVTVPFTKDIVVRNLDLGLFYIIAVSVVSITGLVIAGWASTNKYALLGAGRAVAQLISYELPLIIALLGVAMVVGSLDLTKIVEHQKVTPLIYLQPIGFFIFLVAGLAEVGRTPFDIPQAESELMGGPFIEYSGIHWAMFFLAEYVNTLALAVLTALLFLGGWNGPLLTGPVWLLLKSGLVLLVIFWLRATLPRLRIDQLMAFAWKFVLPLGFANVVFTGFYVYYGWPGWSIFLLSLAVGGLSFYALERRRKARIARILERRAQA